MRPPSWSQMTAARNPSAIAGQRLRKNEIARFPRRQSRSAPRSCASDGSDRNTGSRCLTHPRKRSRLVERMVVGTGDRRSSVWSGLFGGCRTTSAQWDAPDGACLRGAHSSISDRVVDADGVLHEVARASPGPRPACAMGCTSLSDRIPRIRRRRSIEIVAAGELRAPRQGRLDRQPRSDAAAAARGTALPVLFAARTMLYCQRRSRDSRHGGVAGST